MTFKRTRSLLLHSKCAIRINRQSALPSSVNSSIDQQHFLSEAEIINVHNYSYKNKSQYAMFGKMHFLTLCSILRSLFEFTSWIYVKLDVINLDFSSIMTILVRSHQNSPMNWKYSGYFFATFLIIPSNPFWIHSMFNVYINNNWMELW